MDAKALFCLYYYAPLLSLLRCFIRMAQHSECIRLCTRQILSGCLSYKTASFISTNLDTKIYNYQTFISRFICSSPSQYPSRLSLVFLISRKMFYFTCSPVLWKNLTSRTFISKSLFPSSSQYPSRLVPFNCIYFYLRSYFIKKENFCFAFFPLLLLFFLHVLFLSASLFSILNSPLHLFIFITTIQLSGGSNHITQHFTTLNCFH